jgi:hypothetical protein
LATLLSLPFSPKPIAHRPLNPGGPGGAGDDVRVAIPFLVVVVVVTGGKEVSGGDGVSQVLVVIVVAPAVPVLPEDSADRL